MDKQGDEIHVVEEEAAGGSKEGVVRWVLGISLLLAIVLLSLIWIVPALTQGDVEEEMTVSGKMEAASPDEGDGTDSIVSQDADEMETADEGSGTPGFEPVEN
ncbi:hypothetical protein [Qipengyuania sp. JC766]|uniref:hypothetical protein n=1 Tax=Qipengyuania sp. JC766 TaxID=3232139 RepID=UPI00345AC90C